MYAGPGRLRSPRSRKRGQPEEKNKRKAEGRGASALVGREEKETRAGEMMREREEESVAGDESLCHFVMSYRGRNEAERGGRATSNSFWNFGNARGPKSFLSPARRKDVSVSAIKGSQRIAARTYYRKFTTLRRRDVLLATKLLHEQIASRGSLHGTLAALSRLFNTLKLQSYLQLDILIYFTLQAGYTKHTVFTH